ncbi:MAG: exodeoxyribonuclease VII large subunit [Pseudomonadota bacterium]
MTFAFDEKADGEEKTVHSVSGIIALVNEELEEGFGSVWVKGEVGRVTVHQSGHVYFNLKDEDDDAVLSAVMFKPHYMRRSFDLAAGRRVLLSGSLNIYRQRGAFQMMVRHFSDAGEGLLALQFEALKKRLVAEGLTDPERKRPIPSLPRTIGIVTSLEAAALQDMLKILRARLPARIIISPSSVQGEEAPAELIRALERISPVSGLEVVIIGRGGGSAEDLAAFNDERLARSIAAFGVPVISAVGHDVDTSISDLVADASAPTPTAAAQMVIAAKQELEENLHRLEGRLSRGIEGAVARGRNEVYALRQRMVGPERMIMNRRQHLDELAAGLTATVRAELTTAQKAMLNLRVSLRHLHPRSRLERRREQLNAGTRQLEQAMKRRMQACSQNYSVACSRLDALSPLSVLMRGYAIATRARDKAVIKSPGDVEDGERIDLRLGGGMLPCEAKKT